MRTKLSEFLSVECKASPVKLINYDIDKTDNKSVLMGARVKLFEMPVSFPKATLTSGKKKKKKKKKKKNLY